MVVVIVEGFFLMVLFSYHGKGAAVEIYVINNQFSVCLCFFNELSCKVVVEDYVMVIFAVVTFSFIITIA